MEARKYEPDEFEKLMDRINEVLVEVGPVQFLHALSEIYYSRAQMASKGFEGRCTAEYGYSEKASGDVFTLAEKMKEYEKYIWRKPGSK